jgi:YHS domain-containing protein
MANARSIVEQFIGALYGGDPQTARQYLADNLSFRGPAASFDTADTYLKATGHAVRAVKNMQTHKVFAENSDVAVFYDLHLNHRVGSITIADWYHLEGDKIASIRTILDTGPFTATAAETAIDPVCGMTVARTSAAATRSYADELYYFCNVGCAEAFDSQPAHYLQQR